MHTTLETNILKEKLGIVGHVSTKHATLPVLQCVLLEAKESTLLIKATNLELGIEAEVKAVTKEEGTIAVPASTLIQTISLLTERETTLRVEENTLVVEGVSSVTNIKSVPHDEFPHIPKLTNTGQEINPHLFAIGIKAVAFAASQTSIKPELCSINVFQKKEHTLTFVATDIFRLMEKTVPQKGVVLDDALLIPSKNALEIARVCERDEEKALMRTNENQIALEFPDGVYITSRLTSASFPDYLQIMPKEFMAHSTMLKDDLLRAFKKTNIFLNKFFQVGVHATAKNITVSANSSEVGTTAETIPAHTEGDDVTLNFNQRYLQEPLSHITDESITFHFATISRRSVIIEGVNDKSFRYLVMPMNK